MAPFYYEPGQITGWTGMIRTPIRRYCSINCRKLASIRAVVEQRNYQALELTCLIHADLYFPADIENFKLAL